MITPSKSFNYYLTDIKGIFILLFLILVGALAGSFVSLVLGAAFGAEFVTKYSLLITYPIQFAFAIWYTARLSRINEVAALEECFPIDQNRFAPVGGFSLAVMVVAGTLACALVTEPICALLPEMPEALKRAMEMLTAGPLWVALLSTAVFAPLFEEWLCRGIVLRGMLKRYSPTVAIIISAVFFAVIHLNPWQAIPAFLLGCLFGLVYYKTGSLKLTMLMHCANNAFSVLMSRIPQFKDCDYLWQSIGDMRQYYILYAASLVIVGWLVFRLIRIQFKQL